MRKFLGLVVIVSMFVTGVSYAAPVRLPSNAGKTDAVLGSMGNGKVLIGVGAEYDKVDSVKFEDSAGKAEFDMAGVVLSLTYDKWVSVYGTYGRVMNPQFSGNDGADYKLEFDESDMWGVGANSLLYENEGLEFFTDVSYRATSDFDVNTFTYGSTTYTKADLLPGASLTGKWEEWQVALGASKTFGMFKPYAGVKYSDVKFTAKAAASGDSVSESANSKDNIGAFLGVIINPSKGLEFNIQGRFLDETAGLLSATFKF